MRPTGWPTPRSRRGSHQSRQAVSEWRKRFCHEGVAGARGETAARLGRGVFPPAQVAEVKALACELPAKSGVPLSRWSAAEIARAAVAPGIVAEVSGITIWRWLSEDAIRPWNYRSWIFPRDPRFAEPAPGPILDLYEGRWVGQLLEPGDFVVCADEKPSIQARARVHPMIATPPAGCRVEHEYERMGALCYLAAWDTRRARIFDRCAPKDGIEPFDALVDQFMSVEPYRSAQRVFVVVDNGSAHRGQRSIDRLQRAWPNLILVHTPVHASLAQPGRNLLQRHPAQGASAQQLRRPRQARAARCSPSAATTSRSPSRSSGSSPAPRPRTTSSPRLDQPAALQLAA